MKLALFTSNVHEQHLPYKVYGKVDFHFNKSESKEKKNPQKLQLKLLKYLKKFTNTYTYINHITCTRHFYSAVCGHAGISLFLKVIR